MSRAIRFGVLVCAALAVTLAAHGARQTTVRVDGEYGLWVEDRRDTVVVHWLTQDSTAGLLRVQGENLRHEYRTPAGRVHSTAFRRPRTRTITIIYGQAAGLDTTTLFLRAWPRAPAVSGADSVFILADTHGEFDTVVRMLRQAGLIGDDLRWTGGRKHLVLAGDLVDRGPDVIPLLWFVYQLEPQAARAGGRVHVLLGNHETMIWMHDLRYVHAREASIAQAHGVPYPRLFDLRESVLGQWLASKPAVLKLDRILFAHGGISSDFLAYSPQALDDTLARFLNEEWFYRWNDSTVAFKMDSAAYARRVDFLMNERSIFWFRGYVQTDTLGAELNRVLRRFGADLHVVGHTPTTLVHQKYEGRLIAAHPRTPAIEMILLVRDGRGYRRYRIDLHGAQSPLPAQTP
jgi:hypothetical protein